jgi:hypothetical protein
MSATRAVEIQYTTFVVLELGGASGRVAVIMVLLASDSSRVDTQSGARPLGLPCQNLTERVE